MNDDFLKAYRKAPSPRFVEGLRKRLRDRDRPPARSWRHFFVRPLAVVAMLIVSLLALSFALPGARALLAQSINRIIAGLFITEESAGASEQSFAHLQYNDILRWSELDQALPFKFRLPSDVPQGYKLLDVVPVLLPSEKIADLPFEAWTAYAIWMPSSQKHRIVLRVSYYQARDQGEVIVGLPDGSSSAQEVEIEGQPAVFVCKDKENHSLNVDSNEMTSCAGAVKLVWMDEVTKVVYALEAEAGGETIPDLLRMAQSIR